MDSYRLGVQDYVDFCARHGCKPDDGCYPLPSEARLIEFVVWLAGGFRQLSPTVVKQRLRGLALWFTMATDRDPRLLLNGSPRPTLQLTLRSISKRHSLTKNLRAPLTTDKLLVFIRKLRTSWDIPYADRLAYEAVLCFGVLGLCRCGEISTEKTKVFDPAETALRSDMTVFRDADGVPTRLEFWCRSSKTDIFRRSVTIIVDAAGPSAEICPARAVGRYLAATRGFHQSEPLFRLQDGTYITRARVDSMIKKLAHRAGFDTRNTVWSTHSMRAGGATTLSFLGVPGHIIQLLGRWKSDCYVRYLSISADGRRDLMAEMATMKPTDDKTRAAHWVTLRRQM